MWAQYPPMTEVKSGQQECCHPFSTVKKEVAVISVPGGYHQCRQTLSEILWQTEKILHPCGKGRESVHSNTRLKEKQFESSSKKLRKMETYQNFLPDRALIRKCLSLILKPFKPSNSPAIFG